MNAIDLPTVEVTGVSVTALTRSEQVAMMVGWAEQHISKAVCLANVHMLMESRWNIDLCKALEKADLVAPDGMPLVWMMRALGFAEQDRAAGMDVFFEVCKQCEKKNISIYLFGATKDVLEKMKDRLRRDFPQLLLAGWESPPFRPMTEQEDAEAIERINKSGAGVTFVSLGCPKQECWMSNHFCRVKSVMIGVGAVFPVYCGNQRRAPQWIRDRGLEWLFRLAQEPTRLFGRYFKTIPPFIYLTLHQLSTQFSSRLYATHSQRRRSKLG